MPNLEEHCRRTLKQYGVEGRDIHSWLDEPSRQYATAHRQFRHDTETVRLAGEIFGKVYGKSLAENIALDHIMMDHEEEIKRRNTTIVVNLPEKEIPAIPCSYCDTLLKPSDQLCPKCGASRTKIIEQFDRAFEMEKLKLQEEKRKMREELKRELFLKKLSPEERVRWLWITPRDPILQKMVQEDFEKHPELRVRFEQDVEKRRKAKAIKPYVKLFSFLFFVSIPAIYLWTVFVPLGILWFVIGSVIVLAA